MDVSERKDHLSTCADGNSRVQLMFCLTHTMCGYTIPIYNFSVVKYTFVLGFSRLKLRKREYYTSGARFGVCKNILLFFIPNKSRLIVSVPVLTLIGRVVQC